MMKLTGETKLFLGIIVGTIGIIGAAIFFLSKPTQVLSRDELLPSTTQTKGNKDATVHVVEFSDFQCPACKAAKPIIDQVVEEYKDRIVFGYRHFPLDQHEFAEEAAWASEAAGKQGKYWEMYDLLFANQERFSDEVITSLAAELGLDMTQYAADYESSEIRNLVAADRSFGLANGVNSTPTFFINGEKVELFSFNDLRTEIEKALQ